MDESAGSDAAATWISPTELEVGGVTFAATPFDRFESTAQRFCLVKRPPLVDSYLSLVGTLRPATIVEVGVLQGGSTALLALLCRPERMLAIERSSERVGALDELLSQHSLADQVRVAYGLDQADREAVSSAVDGHLGDRPIDLVIDDASHLLDPTRSTFNTLFPRLRPGGAYIIEDWSWAHVGFGVHKPEEAPLTTLVFELVMALPSCAGLIEEIRIDRDWAVVVRGSGDLPGADRAEGFDVSACYSDRGRALLASPAGASEPAA